MGRRNYIQELEYTLAKGVDTTSPLSQLAPGFVREAWNTNLGTTGGHSKRQGSVGQLDTAWSGMAIRSGVEYNSATTGQQTLLFGTDDSGTASLGKVSSGAVVDVQTGLAANKRLAFAQIEERLYAFNGDSTNAPFVYEGVTTRELGIDPPAAAPTAVGGTGGNKGEGSYIFAYSYAIRNTSTLRIVAESSPSELTTLELTSGQNRAILDIVASSATVPSGLEIVVRIWSTVLNGSVLFLEDIIANTTGTYNADASDDALDIEQLQYDNSRLDLFEGYTKAKFPVIARNRLFVAHESRNEVRFSKIGPNGPLIESFPALNYSPVEGIYGSDDVVVGLGQINGVPIVLKARSVGRLEEVGLPEITQSEDLVTYIYREISQTVGAVDHFAQCQVFDELVFLGPDNIYATNGQTIRPIGSLIQATIRALGLSPAKKSKISMINDTKYRRVYIQVFQSQASAQPTLTIVGDYQQYPEFRWTFYGPGADSSVNPGWRAGSFFQLTNQTDGSLEVYFGNSNKDGDFYKINTGEADDDGGTLKGIYFKIVTRPYALDQPLVMKLYKSIRLFAEAASDDYSLELCTKFDLSDEEEFCEEFTIPGTGNNWDEKNWADDAETETNPLYWAGASLSELTYDPHRKAKFMQLVFHQNEKDAPVTLLGWGVSGSIFSGL